MNNCPSVSIIILNWNNYSDTAECLSSLENIEYCNYDVVVVDNGSTDRSGQRLKSEFSWCKFIFNGDNLGFAGGNNIGINYSLEQGYDYILLLNNDTIVQKNFMEPLIETAETKNDAAGVSGVIKKFNSEEIWYADGDFNTLFVRGKVKDTPKSQSDTYQVDQITGALFLLNSDYICRDVLNEEYFLGQEDTELSWEIATSENWNLYVNPNSTIYHKVSSTRGDHNSFRYYHSTRNRIIFAQNNLDALEQIIFLSFLIVTRIIRFFEWLLVSRFDLILATVLAVYDIIRGKRPRRLDLLDKYEN
ncbi:glycosyltransferase family 2 protein [Halopenitus salinus]|uniref:Glycosyltransferase family 2 protein n=1 Tax=Halopenitus salinus TaxID=1198295 RepID=A0ABD5UZQ7_9EURY